MTTLVSWVATQNDGPTSIYIASDSRISWGSGHRRWDAGRKLFACHSSPDLFGYCGDALFPSHFLGQLSELANHHMLFETSQTATDRHARFLKMLQAALRPAENPQMSPFTIVHVAREGVGSECRFFVWRTDHSREQGTRDRLAADVRGDDREPARSLLALGSGADAYLSEVERWACSDQRHTSRGFFTAFCDALKREEDPRSGGVPQLVGLYRARYGLTFGIVLDGRRYFGGLPIGELESYGRTEWRDDAFQRIDPRSLALVRGAQRQVRPRFREQE